MKTRTLLAASLLLLARVAGATQIDGAASGIAHPATLLTFGEVAAQSNDVVTDQYAGYGVTFSRNVFFSPTDDDGPYLPDVDSQFLANYDDAGAVMTTFTIRFGSVQDRASFAMVSNDATWTFEALRDGTTVASFSAGLVQDQAAYYGFEGFSFDAIRISYASNSDEFTANYADLDNLAFGSIAANPVPEPATGVLLVLPLTALWWSARRRTAAIRRR